MSIRAHFQTSFETHGDEMVLKYKRNSSFNLSELNIELMDTDFFNTLNSDSCGFTQINRPEMVQMLWNARSRLDRSTRKNIMEDLQHAKKSGEDYLEYYCF